MSTATYKILVFQGGGDVGEDLDEVGEWRGRRSDILDVREGGDTIRWGWQNRIARIVINLRRSGMITLTYMVA